MSDLTARFDAAVANSKNLSERPVNATLLKIYGLYKQATTGDNWPYCRIEAGDDRFAEGSRCAIPETFPRFW